MKTLTPKTITSTTGNLSKLFMFTRFKDMIFLPSSIFSFIT